MTRVYTVDYLRGILALLIMLYHYANWQKIFVPDASSFLTKNALYGVSLFFIISGFSLTITYYHKFKTITRDNITDYLFKRFSRIYPLFWLIIFLYLSFLFLVGKQFPEISRIISNITISFAFFEGQKGLTAGSWSIGIEIVFYLVLPFLLYLVRRSHKLSIAFLSIFILVSLYYSSYQMYQNCTDKNYWPTYMNLVNHFYFFVFGVLTGMIYYKNNELFNIRKMTLLTTIIGTIMLIAWYPVKGNLSCLLFQENRLILSILCFALFIWFVALNFKIDKKNIFFRILNYFGDISYTIYLLHPIVYLYSSYYLLKYLKISVEEKVFVMVSITILLSSMIHFVYEMPVKKTLLSWKYRNA